MKTILLNAFSLNMLDPGTETYPWYNIGVIEIEVDEVIEILTNPELGGFDSAVGHADTAAVFSTLLGLDVPCERRTVSLGKDSYAIVGQYKGPRLEEGATTLPEEAEIVWYKVEIN
jgi:hypothetical protein